MVSWLCLVVCSCSRHGSGEGPTKPLVIQNIGSDTMVNLAQAWAEEYQKIEPGVSVEVSGGGSGLGIAALINGTADMANSSRKIEPDEEAAVEAKSGSRPREFLVGFDALSIYVHKNNPITAISLEELREIYAEHGKIDRWSQLGVTNIPGARTDRIIRVSRQNNSGTYHYFREVVCGKKGDFKLGSLDMNGSKDVVELVSRTPGAIGYSGLGYNTANVKMLPVSRRKGEPAVLPSVETTLDKSYPISRPMFVYTPGNPPAHVLKYIEWILSPAGQRIVELTGYIPLGTQEQLKKSEPSGAMIRRSFPADLGIVFGAVSRPHDRMAEHLDTARGFTEK
ncbi:MAG: phosphate ABC transporter substrate-binding protein [Verrucomicrobiae bacterium]|nr:phosphate ABC transporter substrate-binding protein [Verrucomicrobiae bacterium]